MEKLTKGLPTKSAKMRALGTAGYSRQEIADFLGVRYQFVRNVLVEANRRAGRSLAGQGVGEQEQAFVGADSDPAFAREVTIGADGNVLLPDVVLCAAGLSRSGAALLRCDDGRIEIFSREEGIRRTREELRKYVSVNTSLVDELLKERRGDAAREQGRS